MAMNLSNIGSLLLGVVFMLASIRTFLTKKIEGKAGLIVLNEYANLISFFLLCVSIIFIYLAFKNHNKS